MSHIIFLKDVYDARRQKQRELEFYKQQLETLQQKMAIVQDELNLTNTIITIIESEIRR